MSKPYIHSISSSKKFGGEPEDYLEIHDLLDSSKSCFPDNRHRALTHNAWFFFIVEKIFGHNITNSAGRLVSVRDICEQHVLEDFGGKYIPAASDYLEHMTFTEWMNNGIAGGPSSYKKIEAQQRNCTRKVVMNLD